MLVTLKNTAGGIYYKVYADHAKKELLLRTEDHQEALDREILIVADIVTEWAANLEQRGPYATAQAKDSKTSNCISTLNLRTAVALQCSR